MKQGYLSYLIELLNKEGLYGVSREVDIAKGMYKAPKGFREFIEVRWRQLRQS
jgi:hypothetical protein